MLQPGNARESRIMEVGMIARQAMLYLSHRNADHWQPPFCNAWVTVSRCCTLYKEQVLTFATFVLPVEAAGAQAVVAAAMRVDCGGQIATFFLFRMATSGRNGHL